MHTECLLFCFCVSFTSISFYWIHMKVNWLAALAQRGSFIYWLISFSDSILGKFEYVICNEWTVFLPAFNWHIQNVFGFLSSSCEFFLFFFFIVRHFDLISAQFWSINFAKLVFVRRFFLMAISVDWAVVVVLVVVVVIVVYQHQQRDC